MNILKSAGTLYVVATPIGNLEDISFRAVKTLKKVDLIAAEDTRHSGRLLSHYSIDTKLISCHEHNETKRIPGLITRLEKGLNIALISDAGTPAISDPGYKLVQAAAEKGIRIIPVPGCSAAIAGLSVSGLATDSFIFLGFLPRKQHKLIQFLESVKTEPRTLICYESPHRIKKLVNAMIQVFGDRQSCLTREITKIHEEYIRASLVKIHEILEKRENIKGECSLFIQGYGRSEHPDITEHQLETIILKHLKFSSHQGTSRLAKIIAEKTGMPRKKIYDMIIKLS